MNPFQQQLINNKLVILLLSSLIFLSACKTIEPKQDSKILKPPKNTVWIYLAQNQNGDYYHLNNKPWRKTVELDMTGVNKTHKLVYKIKLKKNNNFVDLTTRDSYLDINFSQAAIAQTNRLCKKIKNWPEQQNNNVKRNSKGHLVFKIKQSKKHKDKDCYNYDLTVNINNQRLTIDPWIKIKR